jgi:lipid A 3-O-deacylase
MNQYVFLASFLMASEVFASGLSFSYSNDFFTGTDRYYSQGIELDYKNESLKSMLPKTPLFIKPRKINKTNYSLGLNYFGFTPKDPYPHNIQLGDRPFANVLLFLGSTDSFLKKRQIRIKATIKIGAIGPVTGGEFVHKSIHKATGNRLPRGWDNQIRNDLILSYEASLKKHFSFLNNYVEVQAITDIEVGTWKINQSLGARVKLGKVNNFKSLTSNNKINSYYLFISHSISRVYFDATMQGGLINKDSPYKLSSKDVEDYVGKLFAGAHLGFGSFSLRYQQAWMTKEFSLGEKHSFGKLSLNFNY